MVGSEYKSISAKITREEFTLIDEYCRKKGITPSALIRGLLLDEIKIAVPHHLAGSNKLSYNKEMDAFSWHVILDDKTDVEIMKNISPEYLQELQGKINEELNLRDHIIKKKQKQSVPVPSNLLRRKK